MKIRSKMFAVAASGLLVASLSACSEATKTVESVTSETTASDNGGAVSDGGAAETTETVDVAEVEAAIEKYVQFERDDLASNFEEFEGVYESVEVDGALTDGVAVVNYNYVYSTEVDWELAKPKLDEEKDSIISICSDVFANMDRMGVDVPKTLNFNFTDVAAPDEVKWSGSCDSE